MYGLAWLLDSWNSSGEETDQVDIGPKSMKIMCSTSEPNVGPRVQRLDSNLANRAEADLKTCE